MRPVNITYYQKYYIYNGRRTNKQYPPVSGNHRNSIRSGRETTWYPRRRYNDYSVRRYRQSRDYYQPYPSRYANTGYNYKDDRQPLYTRSFVERLVQKVVKRVLNGCGHRWR